MSDTDELPNEDNNKEERESEKDSVTGSATEALTKTNLLLETLVKKVDRQDKRPSELAEKYAVTSGTSTTPIRKSNRQKEVPLQVQVSWTKEFLLTAVLSNGT